MSKKIERNIDLSLGVYESAEELSRKSVDDFGIKLSSSAVRMVALGKAKHHKGFTFKYINKEEVA